MAKSISKSKVATRNSCLVFGLGSAITKDDCEITGSRLPTCRQVLRCMMFVMQNEGSEKLTKWKSAQIVLSKVSVFYDFRKESLFYFIYLFQ